MEQTMDQQSTGMSGASMSAAKKEGKGMMGGMVLCAILAVVGVGFGVYATFLKKPSINEAMNSLTKEDIEAVSVISTESKLPVSEIIEKQEIEVTNPYILRDLNHKLALLHGSRKNGTAREAEKYFQAAVAYNDIGILYSDEELDYKHKAAAAIWAGLENAENYPDFYSISEKLSEEANKERASNGIQNISFEELRRLGFIPYTEANQMYHDLFGTGENLEKASVSSMCTRGYNYIASLDAFVDSMVFSGIGGCGGAGFPSVGVRKGTYKAKENVITLDVSVIVSALAPDWTVFAGFPKNPANTGEETDNPEILGKQALSEYLNSSHDADFDKGEQYRYTFTKNAEGIYAFSKVEKL